MPALVIWGLLGIAGLGAGGYFLHEAGGAVQDTGNAVQTTADSTVKIIIVGAFALYALHETGILKGSIQI